jgi:hypothetical protein
MQSLFLPKSNQTLHQNLYIFFVIIFYIQRYEIEGQKFVSISAQNDGKLYANYMRILRKAGLNICHGSYFFRISRDEKI